MKKQNSNSKDKSLRVLQRSFDLLRLFDQYLAAVNRRPPFNKEIDSVQLLMERYLTSRGPDNFLTHMKLVRGLTLSYLSGKSPNIKERIGTNWVRCNRSGLPSIISPLVSRGSDGKRLALTVLYFTRNMPFVGKADYSTVTDFPEVETPEDFYDWLSSPSNQLSFLQGKLQVDEHTMHSSTKAGPNGPALMTCFDDAASLEEEYIEDLRTLARFVNPEIGIVARYLDNPRVLKAPPLSRKPERGVPRRVIELPDKEGKVRLIAITDYWTQSICRNLHEGLNKILREIPADCTFDQGRFKKILQAESEDSTYASVDLKAATDLMPSGLQATVLGWLSGNPYLGAVWEKVVKGYKWASPKGEILYSRGQPMGIYSSWPMMAITHHLILLYGCSREGVNPKGRYYILGDDLIIKGMDVYEAYQRVCEEVGMQLNKDKTFQSPILLEFAKRFFFNGEEITPFPTGAYLSSRGSVAGLAVALDNSFEKSCLPGLITHTEARRSLFLRLISLLSDPDGKPKDVLYRMSGGIPAWKVLEVTLGLTDLMRKHIEGESAYQTERFVRWLPDASCSQSLRVKHKSVKYIVTASLFLKAKNRLEEYKNSQSEIRVHLQTSDLRTFPNLVEIHPSVVLCDQFIEKLTDITSKESYEVLEGWWDWEEVMKDIINLNSEPLPSLDALYRQEKRSVRRSQVLSDCAKLVLKYLEKRNLTEKDLPAAMVEVIETL